MKSKWVVLKFGGSSVADPALWQIILKITKEKLQLGLKPLLVLSALRNVSNLLESILTQALNGTHENAIKKVKLLHVEFASALGLDAETLLGKCFLSLEVECHKIFKQQRISAKNHAKIVAFGELFSSVLGHAYLEQNIPCVWLDVRTLLRPSENCLRKKNVDEWHHFISAEFAVSYAKKIDEKLSALASVIVTQGFIASDEVGETILLGREGSDTSASYLGVMLSAKNIEIWTDVCGIFTTNPRENPRARQILQLGFDEARRMANFGAKILHPRALLPAVVQGISMSVHGVKDYRFQGTEISHQNKNNFDIYAVVNENNVYTIVCSVEQQHKIKQQLTKIFNYGFDLIFEYIEQVSMLFLLKYVDSSRVIPHKDEINHLLNSTDGVFSMEYDLITLVGQVTGSELNGDNWMIKVINFAIRQDLSLLKIFRFDTVGRLSLLVEVQQVKQWNHCLHKEFIECQFNSHIESYGVSWEG